MGVNFLSLTSLHGVTVMLVPIKWHCKQFSDGTYHCGGRCLQAGPHPAWGHPPLGHKSPSCPSYSECPGDNKKEKRIKREWNNSNEYNASQAIQRTSASAVRYPHVTFTSSQVYKLSAKEISARVKRQSVQARNNQMPPCSIYPKNKQSAWLHMNEVFWRLKPPHHSGQAED